MFFNIMVSKQYGHVKCLNASPGQSGGANLDTAFVLPVVYDVAKDADVAVSQNAESSSQQVGTPS